MGRSAVDFPWSLGGGWHVPQSQHDYDKGVTTYQLVHDTGVTGYVDVPVNLPDELLWMNLMYLLHKKIEQLNVALAAHAMFGGGDVRPESDGA